ncbi:DUF2085 domain-containing protein [Leptospira paudalimensis]|uniref:DUF2085 domain-containing protein n=1 Tax=Leptospira paudalimensis TaxID=2950024 RepID=A0ABT3M787_9LEPT|nr:DUF2085 domain-containing protein [Leptospira paudalimensis]MCW7503882.1 DUF2085 domain-containing protein [Leptospira paudalimensis]
MCHQLSERSFYYKGSQFPVCARCTGVIIGQIFALLSIIIQPIRFGFIAYISLMLPALIDWSLQEFIQIKSNNFRRIVTGSFLGFGYVMTCVVLVSFAFNFKKN